MVLHSVVLDKYARYIYSYKILLIIFSKCFAYISKQINVLKQRVFGEIMKTQFVFMIALLMLLIGITGCEEEKIDVNRNARNHLRNNDFEGAIAAFDTVIAKHPDNASAYYFRGYAKFELKMFDDAIQDLTRSIALAPKDADAYLLRGMISIEKSDFAFGCKDLKKAAEMGNKDAEVAYTKFCQ